MTGPCAKQTVKATVVALDGRRYVSTNWCHSPQDVCPRAPGEGYAKCISVCQQSGHAEINALQLAGTAAKGATLYVEGHTYACGACLEAADKAGIAAVVISEGSK